MHFIFFLWPPQCSIVRVCGISPSSIHRSTLPSMDLLNRMVKIEQMVARSDGSSSQHQHSPERAHAHWRTVMEKVADVMDLAKAQARVSGWQADGSAHGSPSWSQVSATPQAAPTVAPTVKEMAYAEMIRQGNFLGRRKCKQESTLHVDGDVLSSSQPIGWSWKSNSAGSMVQAMPCSLASGPRGNEASAEQESGDPGGRHDGVHAPWSICQPERTSLADGTKVTKAYPMTPPRKTTPGPATPVKTPWPPMSSLESLPSSLAATPMKMTSSQRIKCKCGVTATQLQVKKSGPTQGRLFWKCSRRICDFFERDPEEVRVLQEELMKKEEDRKAQEFEEAIAKEKNEVIDDGNGGGAASGSHAGPACAPRDGEGDAAEPEDGDGLQRSQDSAQDLREGNDLLPDDATNLHVIGSPGVNADRRSYGGIRSIMEDGIDELACGKTGVLHDEGVRDEVMEELRTVGPLGKEAD